MTFQFQNEQRRQLERQICFVVPDEVEVTDLAGCLVQDGGLSPVLRPHGGKELVNYVGLKLRCVFPYELLALSPQ